MNEDFKLVIARYHENINWVNDQNYPYIVYNKGEPLPQNINHINLLNIGKESLTYLYHIIENYENIDNYTIFLQGNPFDHSKFTNGKDIVFPKLKFMALYGGRYTSPLICDKKGKPHHPIELPIGEILDLLLPDKHFQNKFVFNAGAQFLVCKENILKYPKDFYVHALNLHLNKNFPTMPWVFERIWATLFNI